MIIVKNKPPKNRLVRKVKLVFFEDDANGEWGLTHKDTFDDNYGNGFNAFWNGIGIFHDVFEHAHEYTHKYFRGNYAMNVGGEMTAMGAMWYYYDALGVGNRMNSGAYIGPGESMKRTTLDEIHESVEYGYCRYGSTLESNVPKQRSVDNSELEYQIADFHKKVRQIIPKGDDEMEKAYARDYKKSVTFRKIADLHRYGYRMGEKLVPFKWENREMCYDFIHNWETFCKNNPAEYMKDYYKSVTFNIYKNSEDIVSWKAIFHPDPYIGLKKLIITDRNIRDIKNLIEYY